MVVLSLEEKSIYLKYFSVARYSAGYWHNEIYVKKVDSKWYPFLDTPAGFPIWDIIGGDAAGAELGGLIGGPIGAGVGGAIVSCGVYIDWLW